jgi:excisionase family DNA binding protein
MSSPEARGFFMSDSGFGSILLKIDEAAAFLKIHKGTLYRLASRRAVVSYKIEGTGLRFKPSDLERFVNKGKRTKKDLVGIVGSQN